MATESPEGAAIDAARKRKRISGRQAALAAGVSDGWWRQTIRGTAHPSAETLARMAVAVELDPDEMRTLGRDDVANEIDILLRHSQPLGAGEADDAARMLTEELNPALEPFSSRELLAEIETRIVLLAARLPADARDEWLSIERGASYEDVLTTRPRVSR